MTHQHGMLVHMHMRVMPMSPKCVAPGLSLCGTKDVRPLPMGDEGADM